MAGKIKKGFTTYLLVLVIALVAAFMICVTVMLFQPFKNVLGFQYFIYNSEDVVYNVTGGAEGEIFDFSTIEEIKVDCDYASVSVKRDDEIESHAVRITNKTKGFARENQDTSFAYELSYEDSSNKVLNIEVKEPEGFIFFGKQIEISVILPVSSTYALENTKIDVSTKSGSIKIGNDIQITTVGSNEIDANSLSLKTNSGKIFIYPFINTTFDELFISSNSGKVNVMTDITAQDNFDLYSKSSEIKLKNLDVKSEYAEINIANSNLNAKTIKGNVNIAITSGYFDVDRVEGNVVCIDANAQMKSATINVGEVTGAVSLPFVNKSNVTIGKMGSGSEFYANATSGKIKIDETYGKVYVETTSGDVDVHTFANDIEIKTTSGDINVIYESTAIANQLDFITQRGKINLKVKSNLGYTLAVYDTDGKLRDNGVTIEGFEDKFVQPLPPINGGTEKIVIITDKSVNISLIETA